MPPTTFTVPEGWYVYSQCGYGYGNGYGNCGYFPPGTVVEIPGYTVPGAPSGSQASSGDPFSIQLAPNLTASVNGNPNFGEVTLAPAPGPSRRATPCCGRARRHRLGGATAAGPTLNR